MRRGMKLRKLLLAALCALPLMSPFRAQADWLDPARPLDAAIRPADGMPVQQTPPDFSWPDVSKDARYTVNLAYPGGKTKSLAAPQNYLNWNEVLLAGSYSWTVTAVDSSGTRTSQPRKFTVDADSKPFLVPDMNALLAKM